MEETDCSWLGWAAVSGGVLGSETRWGELMKSALGIAGREKGD